GGDRAPDIPMLALAKRPFAPAHGKQALGGRCSVTRGSYQKGFAEAVGSLLGHAPGSCAQCALASPSAERRLLLAQLGQPYERVPIDIFAGETLSEEFRRRNPARTTPVLEIGGGACLPES